MPNLLQPRFTRIADKFAVEELNLDLLSDCEVGGRCQGPTYSDISPLKSLRKVSRPAVMVVVYHDCVRYYSTLHRYPFPSAPQIKHCLLPRI